LGVMSEPDLSIKQEAHSMSHAYRTGQWQTFTAVESGYLHSIEILQAGGHTTQPTATISIYKGVGTGGTLLGSVSLNIETPSSAVWRRTPEFNMPIAAGELYTIHHGYAYTWYYYWGYWEGEGDIYLDGLSSLGGDRDFTFRIYMR